MDWIFGKPAEELDLDELRAFLDEAGDEPLTWELKGDEKEGRWVRREQVLKAVCGFGNSDRGGVLLIGGHKRRGAAGWDMPGLAPPADEPGPLLEKWLRDGFIRPPKTRVHIWAAEEGRVCAAVTVWPTPDPPCVTADGQVFQRTSGETVAVRDPVALARLVDQGRAAWTEAGRRVARAAQKASSVGDPTNGAMRDVSWKPPVFSLAVSCTGLSDDMEFRAFLPRTRDAIVEAASALPGELVDAGVPYWHMDQESFGWGVMRFSRTWLVLVHREGAIATSFGWNPDEGSAESLGGERGPIRLAWDTSVALLVDQLGGTGRGRLHVLLHGQLPRFGVGQDFHVDRAIELRSPTLDEVDSVVREIRRAAGDNQALEPGESPS